MSFGPGIRVSCSRKSNKAPSTYRLLMLDPGIKPSSCSACKPGKAHISCVHHRPYIQLLSCLKQQYKHMCTPCLWGHVIYRSFILHIIPSSDYNLLESVLLGSKYIFQVQNISSNLEGLLSLFSAILSSTVLLNTWYLLINVSHLENTANKLQNTLISWNIFIVENINI